MPREVNACLWDIVRSAHLIFDFTESKDFADYESDIMLRSAVERQFEIVGEALNQAIRISPDARTDGRERPRGGV